MAGYKRHLIVIAEEAGDEAYLREFEKEQDIQAYDETVFMRDVWYGPFSDAGAFYDGLGAIGCGILFADPERPSDLFILRKGYNDAETLRNLISNGFEDPGEERCFLRRLLPLEGINDPLHTAPLVILENTDFPYARKDIFFRDYRSVFKEGICGTAGELFDYIRNNTSYDCGIICRELIAKKNMADLKKNVPLDRIISGERLSPRTRSIKKIALRLHLYYEDEAAFCRKYIENMPEGTDVYITVPDEKKKTAAEKAFAGMPYKTEFRIVGNRGRDISAFLTGMKDVVNDYDLICVVHDKKVVQAVPRTIGASWAYLCFENLLSNKTYVENIISEFERDPFLGMLQPPLPMHSVYYPVIGKGEWSGACDIVKEVASMLGINVDIDPEKEPVAPLGDMFWVRPEALRPFFDHDWKYEEYPKEPLPMDRTILHAIERTYQFAVQQAGYYNSWVLSESYAGIAIDNMEYMNDEIVREIMKRTGPGKLSFILDALEEDSPNKGQDHTYDDLKSDEEAP